MSAFVYKLGMDISEFTKSISEVEDELKRLKDSLKTATKQGIVETNIQIKALENSLVDLKKVGLDQLPKGVANGTQALFSLNQVARDLPFGFIAIQNNLPLVVDSFGQLTKQAGGLGPALKSIGSALIGPAGISFAFGAVIAGVTALIQKYGSLGEAFTQILGGTNALTKEQKLYNEEVAKAAGNLAAEEAKVNILTKTLLDNSKPQKDRIAAYRELKKIAPDVVAGIREENVGTEISNTLIDSNAKKRIELIKLKIRESGINAVLSKNSEDIAIQQDKLNQLIAERGTLLEKQKKGDKYVDPETGKVFDVLSAVIAENESRLIAQRKAVEDLYKVNNNFLSQLDPIINGIANINSETENRIRLIKEEDKELKKGEQDQKKKISDAIKRQKEFSQSLKDENAELQKGEDAFNRLLLLRDKFTKGTDFSKKLQQSTKVFEKFRKDNVEVPNIGDKGPIFYPSQTLIDEQNRIKALQNTFNTVKGNLENVFFNPMSDLFSNFFETGKLAFADFGKAILKTISQIVAKIIATGVINLIAGLLVPGAGKAIGAAKGIGGAFTSAIGSVLGLGKTAAPSFAGVGAGEMGMSGQVNVVLRGQDLVGALNRTNSTINRVG